jgi:hypothetical protein
LLLTVFIVLAGLMGASGIILAAAGAHAAPNASPAHMLLFHAAAVLSGSLAILPSALSPDIASFPWRLQPGGSVRKSIAEFTHPAQRYLPF